MPRATSYDQEWFVSGYGLSRHIVFRQLQYFLGPDATVRPYSYQGREGYLIKGGRLTTQQIEDLKRQSKEYERQQAIRLNGRGDHEDANINEPVPVNSGRRSPGSLPYHRYR